MRRIYSVSIALLLVVNIYKVPFSEIGFATLFLFMFSPYVLVQSFGRFKISLAAISVIVTCLYYVTRSLHGITETKDAIIAISYFLTMIHVIGAFNDSIDIFLLRKTIEIVSCIMTALILMQFISYYLFNTNLVLVFEDFVLEENKADVLKQYSVTNLFRPSALFLEPSHYAQYTCVGFMSSLFPFGRKRANGLRAMWIALGIVLSTSGIGIVLCICIFGWYLLFNGYKNGTKIVTILFWFLCAIIGYVVLYQIPAFQQVIQRIVGQDSEGYNAIWGRTLFWKTIMDSITSQELVIGRGVIDMPEFYMTGFMRIVYSYGYLGVGLLAISMILLAVKRHTTYTICSIVIFCGLMPFANVFGYISLTFWLCLIVTNVATVDMRV